MKAAGGLAAGVLLFFASVTLHGCGGGDAPTTPAPPVALKLVSQTYQCKEAITQQLIDGEKPPKMSYNLMIDAEGLKWRNDATFTQEGSSPLGNFSVNARISSVFDLATKRHTLSNASTVTFNKVHSLPTQKGCVYFEVPQIQESDVKACLDKKLGSMSLVTTGERIIPPSQKCYAMSTAETFLYVDEGMVWKNLIMSQTDTSKDPPKTIETEMPDPDSKGGVPSSDVFQIPEDWGTCTKATEDQINALENLLPHFLTECAGLNLPPKQNSQAQLMSAKLQELVAKHKDQLLRAVV